MMEINKPVGMDSGKKNENPYKTNENGVGINKPPRSHFTKSHAAKTLIKTKGNDGELGPSDPLAS